MRNRRSANSWQANRSRRHAAYVLGSTMPPTPTPVPDDDDEFDWPGSTDVSGNPISSRHAFLYGIAKAADCYTVLLGQKDGATFRDIVTRKTDAPLTQVVARRYDNGTGTAPLVWCANPFVPGTGGTRKYGQYVIDHVLYAKVCSKTGQSWLADHAAHSAWFNPDPHFFDVLNFDKNAQANAGQKSVDAVGKLIARKESAGGGFKLKWKAVKVAIVGASGWGSDKTPRHFGANELATLVASTATEETYQFGHPGKLQATEAHGNTVRGAFLVGYGLYERTGGGMPPQEFYAVTPPINCEHPLQQGDPEKA